MDLRVDDIVEHLKKLKAEQGDEAYRTALTGLAKNILTQGETAPFVQSLLEKLDDEMDLGALQKEAAELRAQRAAAQEVAKEVAGAPDFNQAMLKAMKQQMPGLKTQAQFDLVMKTFEALQIYLNAAFLQNHQEAAYARDALNQALDLAPKLAMMAEEAAASPEIPTNPDFTAPPKQFTEEATCEQLLAEVEGIASFEKLAQWYSANRGTMDGIVNTSLRNRLFDRIRSRRKELG